MIRLPLLSVETWRKGKMHFLIAKSTIIGSIWTANFPNHKSSDHEMHSAHDRWREVV